MTTNNIIIGENTEILDGITTSATSGTNIIEEDAFNKNDELKPLSENNEILESFGGIEIIGSIMELSAEDFEDIKGDMLNVFIESLNDPIMEKELQRVVIAESLDSESIKTEFEEALKIINSIESLSEPKKYFIRTIFTLTAGKLQDIISLINTAVYIPCELSDGTKLPTYAHETDAGLDIYAREEITIAPGETKIIGTGIKMAIPEGYAILIQPRSGQSVKTKLRIANTPGLIDAGYRDEIGVIIENIEPPFKDISYDFDDNGEIHINSIIHGEAYTITEGQRFAQMRLVQVPKANFVEVGSVGDIGEDRNGGFGSTDTIG